MVQYLVLMKLAHPPDNAHNTCVIDVFFQGKRIQVHKLSPNTVTWLPTVQFFAAPQFYISLNVFYKKVRYLETENI